MKKMKRKNQIRMNRVASALLTLALVLCQVCFLSACGRVDVERNKVKIEKLLPDSMDASDVADMLEDGMSVDEVIDRVEETSNNFFQFVMPGKNIIVKAIFSDGSVSTIPIVDEKTSEDIEYQDITNVINLGDNFALEQHEPPLFRLT